MDQSNYHKTPSKILLFGEYLILDGGHALSIPYPKFNLYPILDESDEQTVFLIEFYEYISSLWLFNNRISDNFYSDIQNGLYYQSSIPIGYGLGSSGALVANIYQNYITNPEKDLMKLKEELALLENYFHDKSSGIDPLTCYLNQAIYLADDKVKMIDEVSLGSFELVDSGIQRNASDAIKLFKSLKSEALFHSNLNEMKILNNQMIAQYIQNEPIIDLMRKYSTIQLETMGEFIPGHIKLEWIQGLQDGSFSMKLCGAGLGGFFLKYNNGLNN